MSGTDEAFTIEKQVRKLRQVKPNPTWRAGLRSLVVKKASPRAEGLSIFWKGKIFAVGTLVLLFFFGTGVLAESSLPGDSLYPIKKRFEEMKLTNLGKRSKLEVRKELTQRRVADLTKVVRLQKNQVNQAIHEVRNSVMQVQEQMTQAKTEYQTLAEAGQDTTQVRQTLTELKPAIKESQSQLSSIQPSLNETEQKEISLLIISLGEIEKEVEKVTHEEEQPTEQAPDSPLRISP